MRNLESCPSSLTTPAPTVPKPIIPIVILAISSRSLILDKQIVRDEVSRQQQSLKHGRAGNSMAPERYWRRIVTLACRLDFNGSPDFRSGVLVEDSDDECVGSGIVASLQKPRGVGL